tara:strand:+ start:32 stop:568 length:537 start_codon:yes stop_codon:yes gene_type:complete
MANNFHVQKITSGDKTKIGYPSNDYKSMTFANTHTSAITMSLYVTSQLGTDITSTTVLAAETETASSSSVTLTVDTVNATDDVFKAERVYKSDGTLFGTCSSVTNTTTIVFSTGLTNTIANNDVLYTGTRYTILNEVSLPVGASLQLHPEDFTFDTNDFSLYINSSNASGLIDIITRR